MKFVRYLIGDKESYGILKKNKINKVNGDPFTGYQSTSKILDINEVILLTPVVPSKIVGLGYNYKDLVGAKENYDEPVIFLKSPNSLLPHGSSIIIPEKRKVWTEVELVIVISKEAKNIRKEDAANYILGYTIGNDVTMENVIGRDHHLARSKSVDTFAPIGRFIETSCDSNNLKIENRINGEIFQSSNTNKRILNDNEIVALVSKYITLLPGDLIFTGSCANAESSIINKGDKVTLTIEGLGNLTNSVQ